MTERGDSISEQRLEAYLDRLMSPAECAAFEQQIADHPELQGGY